MPLYVHRGLWRPVSTYAPTDPDQPSGGEVSGPVVEYVATAAVSAFVYDVTEPVPQNVGPAAYGFTNLVPYTGDITVNDGQVVSGRYINGHVTVNPGGIFRGNAVRGNSTPMVWPGRSSLVQVNGSAINPPIVEGNDIGYLGQHHVAMNCIIVSGHAKILRNYLHDGTDSIKSKGDGVEIAGNLFDRLSYNASDPDQNGTQTHNDHVQIDGDSPKNKWIHGNAFWIYPSPSSSIGTPPYSQFGSGITLSPPTGQVTGIRVTKNWMRGGQTWFQANAVPTGQAGASFGEISGNRSSRDQWTGEGGPNEIRYAVAYGEAVGQLTNFFDPALPGVVESGRANRLFSVGDGIKRG